MRRNQFDKDVIVCAVQEYLDGKSSQLAIAKRLGIQGETFRQWVKNYQAMGTRLLQRILEQRLCVIVAEDFSTQIEHSTQSTMQPE